MLTISHYFKITLVVSQSFANKSDNSRGTIRLVRPGKVVYSNGCESRSGKAGKPPDRELWVGVE